MIPRWIGKTYLALKVPLPVLVCLLVIESAKDGLVGDGGSSDRGRVRHNMSVGACEDNLWFGAAGFG